MSKRNFLKSSAILGSAGLLTPGLVFAAGAPPQVGKDYRVIQPPQRTEVAEGKIEVIEFFWYACPHCYALEPVIHDWAAKLPADVELRRVHVAFRAPRHQQIFYTLLALKEDQRLGGKVFEAIHKDRKRMEDTAEIFAWAKDQGLDEALFKKTFDSFGIRTAMKRASQQVESFGVDGVPALAVGGKYLTAPSMAGSNGRALEVVDSLIDLERKAG